MSESTDSKLLSVLKNSIGYAWVASLRPDTVTEKYGVPGVMLTDAEAKAALAAARQVIEHLRELGVDV